MGDGGARRWPASVALALAMVCGAGREGAAGHSVPCTSIGVPPGTIYLYPDTASDAVFQGNSFSIDGNDGQLNGTPGPKDAIVGFATRTEANAQEVRDSLAAAQLDNIIGKGFSPGPPIEPSVAAVSGPSAAQLDQFVADLLTRPHVVDATAEFTGNHTLGTVGFPQITHLVGQGSGVTVRANANVSGGGILIVENALAVVGTLDFRGLVIVRGALAVASGTEVTGLATFYGSVWTTGFSVIAGGSLIARYSGEALGLAEVAGASAVCEAGCAAVDGPPGRHVGIDPPWCAPRG